MDTGLLHTHSLFRYVILSLSVLVIIRLLIYRDKFRKRDKQLVLWLMIVAHLQLLIGIGLLFLSPHVHFNDLTMKEPELRYWSVEHGIMMTVVVVLITLARIYSRKSISDSSKRKRVMGLVSVALLLIVITLSMSGRGVFIPTS